ncbi:uncharacterized protein LOC134187834 isoform X2 [Corticium candelabrum]|uniref:uncharacterized protein LOC134187834 isoform X2 n=1 Tax=Corticium candelabrum TaxID=121492 RepID=UPI002E260BAE|nr:uncharacterized protein LOC134187834 isoform X2 [Corticium candelabrum]
MVRKGSPDKGEALLSESLSIKRTAFPIDNSTIAATLSWLARSLKDQHKYRDASQTYEEQLEIEKHLGPGREASIATARKNLSLCKEKQAAVAKQTRDHQQDIETGSDRQQDEQTTKSESADSSVSTLTSGVRQQSQACSLDDELSSHLRYVSYKQNGRHH